MADIMSEPFDIDEIKALDTAEVAVVHPFSGLPTTWIWTLAGPGHPKAIAASNNALREMLRVQKLKDQAQANRKKWIEPDRSPEEVRLDNVKSFALRVLGWTPAKINGADYPYSYENVVELLNNQAFTKLYTQLLEYFTSDESFTKPSATTSPTSPNEISS
jgi:hypothetical protein